MFEALAPVATRQPSKIERNGNHFIYLSCMILFSLVFHCIVLLGLVAYAVNARNAYEILNLTTTHFTNGELKQKYRALAKRYHPDKFRNTANMTDINAKFLEITNAFEMLHNKPRNDDTVESLSLDFSIFFSGRRIKYTHHRKKKVHVPFVKGLGFQMAVQVLVRATFVVEEVERRKHLCSVAAQR